MFDGAHDDTLQLCAFEGFEEIVDRSAAEGAGDDVNVVDGGEHDDRHAGMVGADLVEQGEAVGAGHHDVGEDEVVVGVLLEPRPGPLQRCLSWWRRIRYAPAGAATTLRTDSSSSTTRIRSCGMALSLYRLVGRFGRANFRKKLAGGAER